MTDWVDIDTYFREQNKSSGIRSTKSWKKSILWLLKVGAIFGKQTSRASKPVEQPIVNSKFKKTHDSTENIILSGLNNFSSEDWMTGHTHVTNEKKGRHTTSVPCQISIPAKFLPGFWKLPAKFFPGFWKSFRCKIFHHSRLHNCHHGHDITYFSFFTSTTSSEIPINFYSDKRTW